MDKKVIRTFSCITFVLLILIVIFYRTQIQSSSSKQISADHPIDTVEVSALVKKGDFYFNKANRTKSDLDSSFLIISKAYQLSDHLDYKKGIGLCLDMYSKIYQVQGDTLTGRQYADSAIAVFKNNNLFYELGFAYYNRSGFYPLEGELLKTRIEWVKLAGEAFTQSGSKLKRADILRELGDLHQLALDFNASLLSLQQSLVLYKQLNNSIGAIGVYDLLGNVLSVQGNYRLAVKYGLLALKTINELNDSSFNSKASMATIYNRIGLNYERMKRYQLAFQYYDKGYRICMESKDRTKLIVLTYNKAKVLHFLGNTTEAMHYILEIPKDDLEKDWAMKGYVHGLLMVLNLKLKEYDKCRFYRQQLLKDYEFFKMKGLRTTSIANALIKYYLAIGEWKNAEIYLKENEEFMKRFKLFSDLTAIYKDWAQLDSIKGDFSGYIEHAKRYQILHDSSLNERNNQEIAQLQIEYETEKKDRDILLKTERIKLLNAENKIQVVNLKQAMLVRNVTIGGVVLLIIIVILLYSRYQFKNKINVTITQKNTDLRLLVTEKEWLLKEIHHRVKNNLQIIISLLDSQSMYLHDNAALSAIRDSQTRVHSMSLIHKKLYQTDNISTINMSLYIHELVEYLVNAFGVHQDIRFELNVADVQLNVSQSIPIGLILNEAITNSIKYAFTNSPEGRKINIHLSVNSNRCLLLIHDNGIGLPAEFNEDNVSSLGMNLMKGLSEDIDASFSIKNKNGTCIEIAFDIYAHVPQSPLHDQPLLAATTSLVK